MLILCIYMHHSTQLMRDINISYIHLFKNKQLIISNQHSISSLLPSRLTLGGLWPNHFLAVPHFILSSTLEIDAILSPFCRRGSAVSERLGGLPKFTRLVVEPVCGGE